MVSRDYPNLWIPLIQSDSISQWNVLINYIAEGDFEDDLYEDEDEGEFTDDTADDIQLLDSKDVHYYSQSSGKYS